MAARTKRAKDRAKIAALARQLARDRDGSALATAAKQAARSELRKLLTPTKSRPGGCG